MKEAILKEYLVADKKLELFIFPGETFLPNQTTSAIYRAVNISPGDTGIEIGAGIGPGTIYMGLNPNLKRLDAVEIVPEQVTLLKKNVAKYNLENKVEVYQSSLFESLGDLKADFIVSDVSGMNNVGVALGWYPSNVPCGGDYGTANIVPLIEQTPSRLNPNNPDARLYIPVVVNFSDKEKILSTLRSKFSYIEMLSRNDIPLTSEQVRIIDNWLNEDRFRNRLYPDIERRGTRGRWALEVYVAKQPRY